MSIDWASLLYAPEYSTFGIDARITPEASPGSVDVTAIDKTLGAVVAGDSRVDVQTIRPVASVMLTEITEKGLTRYDLDRGQITLHVGTANEKTWRIQSHQLRPSPEGEDAGEVDLILSDENIP